MDVIIVINGDHTETKVILLEYSIKMRSLGHKVLMLDYSEAASRHLQNRISRLKTYLLYRDRLKKLIPNICREFDIDYVECCFDKQALSLTERPVHFQQVFKSLVSSSLALVTGDRHTNYKELSRQRQKRLYKTFASVHDQIISVIESRNKVEIVTLNGRFLIDGAAVYAARNSSVEYILLERAGHKIGRYSAYGKSPHSVLENRKVQDAHWHNYGPERDSKALEGLQKKMQAPLDNLASWETDFTNEIEFKTTDNTKNVIFFPSMDLERPSYKYWEDIATFNGDQALAFREFANIAKRYGFKIFVRVHPPGPRGKSVTDKADAYWQKIAEEVGAEIFFSRSGVDSNALMRDASLVVTYRSTIAIESILNDKPTLILDETSYSHYVPECCAFTTEEIELFFQNGFQLIPHERLYPWGLFYISGGEEFKIITVDATDDIKFRGIALYAQTKFGKSLKRLRARVLKLMKHIS